ncbi:MAG TPA: sterol desaturase family protein [Anaerolineaceae bacterium]|nr:sterol desaturase family protein [Anaerolineaceae bacterium]
MAQHRIEINHDPEPIRLFQSNFMEFFTHIHPAVVVLIWAPFGLYMLYRGVALHPAGASWAYLPIGFIMGVLVWSFSEYNLHRFVFHFRPRSPRQERVIFLFHGVHHAQPQCKTRLVMPPIVSIPLGVVFYALFTLIASLLGSPHWAPPLISGFTFGYLTYDLTHYATHHFPMRWGFLKFLKRYHMLHHYRTPDQRFGVSSPLWDVVYGTMPVETK